MIGTARIGERSIRKIETRLSGLFALEPRVFGDARGFFLESYNERTMAELGIREHFVQDNHSFSTRNVIRGLHYQVERPQGKLVRVIAGEILDVAVDLRRSSPTFGQWDVVQLSGENKRSLWIPAGLAHGFAVLADAHVLYKASDFYHPDLERTILWNDPDLNIDWKLEGNAIISDKDQRGTSFRLAPKFD